VLKGGCEIKFVKTKNKLIDMTTKPLARNSFNKLRTELESLFSTISKTVLGSNLNICQEPALETNCKF